MPASLVSFRIATDPPARLDKALARDVPDDAALSRSRLARLIAEGAVTVNGAEITDARAKVAEGDAVEIAIDEPEDWDVAPEAIPLVVVHEDADLIVVDKPAGMVVHPAPGSPSGTLVNALLHHFGDDLSGIGGEKRPGIVHRIDKDTSGLLVVAKSDRAHHGLAAQFADHSAERLYLAVCHGVPDPAAPRLHGLRGVSFEGGMMKITSGLARHRTDRQRQAVVWDGSGRHAVTRVKVQESFGTAAALVECQLETGRTHQIRVHMAHCGHGLVGDPVYGNRRLPPSLGISFARQALHAATLGFIHPVTGVRLSFAAPVPGDMEALLTALRGAT